MLIFPVPMSRTLSRLPTVRNPFFVLCFQALQFLLKLFYQTRNPFSSRFKTAACLLNAAALSSSAASQSFSRSFFYRLPVTFQPPARLFQPAHRTPGSAAGIIQSMEVSRFLYLLRFPSNPRFRTPASSGETVLHIGSDLLLKPSPILIHHTGHSGECYVFPSCRIHICLFQIEIEIAAEGPP